MTDTDENSGPQSLIIISTGLICKYSVLVIISWISETCVATVVWLCLLGLTLRNPTQYGKLLTVLYLTCRGLKDFVFQLEYRQNFQIFPRYILQGNTGPWIWKRHLENLENCFREPSNFIFCVKKKIFLSSHVLYHVMLLCHYLWSFRIINQVYIVL